MISDGEVFAAALAEQMQWPDPPSLASRLVSDLGLDSLSLLLAITVAEDLAGGPVAVEWPRYLHTVGDLWRYHQRVAAR